MIFYIARSRKSKRYFKFSQYADDGYGKFEATVSHADMEGGELPAVWTPEQYRLTFVEKTAYTSEFANHDVDRDVEFFRLVTFIEPLPT